MAYNYSKLKGLIVEKYNTQSAFATAMGMSKNNMSLKMRNRVPFSQAEISKMVNLLDIEKTLICDYFFDEK